MKFWLKYKDGAYHNELLGEQISLPESVKYLWIALVGILTYLFSSSKNFPILMIVLMILGTKFKTKARGTFGRNPFTPLVVDYAQLSLWGFILGGLGVYISGT